MKLKAIIICYIAFLPLFSNAQVRGVISDKQTGEALVGASVYWLQAKKGTTTNQDGIFNLATPLTLPDYLVVSHIGYQTDTIIIKKPMEVVIRLQSTNMKEAVITEEKIGNTYNLTQPLLVQTIGTKELKKAACCNLSESFETNATVDISYGDAVSGNKQLKLLGLDGAYTQILFEQQPGIRGLSTNYGLMHVPGTWIKSIDITKGSGSVVNGYESMSGQVNIDFIKPEQAEKLFVNLYAGDFGRFEANIHSAFKINNHWKTLLLTHAGTVNKRNDFNKDGYMDMPLSNQLNVINRWQYEKAGKLMINFGVQAMQDQKTGGSMQFNRLSENTNQQHYGVQLKINHLEGFGKIGIGFKNKLYKTLVFQTTGRFYEHDAVFGLKKYNGQQQTWYGNLVYSTLIISSDHKIKAGASMMYDQYQESYHDTRFNDSLFNRTEQIAGIFAEYQLNIKDKGNLLLGFRSDYHNMFGWLITPRAHFKWNVTKYSALRLNAGRGMRTANPFVEQPAIMASNRVVRTLQTLRPEVSWNYGISYSQFFKINKGNISWVSDYFYTHFTNQTVIDLDINPQVLHIYNLNGQSYSHTFQSELGYEPIKKLEIRLAYKYQLARTEYQNGLLLRPFVPAHKALFNIGYATKFDKWKYDLTVKWFGIQRIPDTENQPHHMNNGLRSPEFTTVNAQITRAFKKWEMYVGIENAFNEMQHHQIIDAQNPFGSRFDAAMIWGPVMGRVLYTGIRLSIK
ncbi:MAG: TonB-dependent receptor [Bacteroidia bacterium]|jgi:outer membrane receptor for ferrienterochelin and colicin|nr:TonB-dependent receptor [Bacteroidia bacterium]